MSNRSSRRKLDSATAGPAVLNEIFLIFLDDCLPRVGMTRTRIEELLDGAEVTPEELSKLATCLVMMAGVALPERKTQ